MAQHVTHTLMECALATLWLRFGQELTTKTLRSGAEAIKTRGDPSWGTLRTSVPLYPPRPPLRPPHTTMTPLYCMYGQPVRDSSADLDPSSQPRKEDIRIEVNKCELVTYFFWTKLKVPYEINHNIVLWKLWTLQCVTNSNILRMYDNQQHLFTYS